MTLKLYYDLLSQPSRALVMFLQAAKVPFEHCPVALRKGEHLTDEYKENVNRFQKVPVIDDNGFKMTESIAIVRYLAREKLVPDHWYSRDSKKQARIDEYLEWQHNNTRFNCAMYFQIKWLRPIVTGKAPNASKLATYESHLNICMDSLEELWLKDSKYLIGDKITVADLFGACEIEQPRIAGYDARIGRPKLAAWLERVRNEMNPYYDDVHTVVYDLIEKFHGEPPMSVSIAKL